MNKNTISRILASFGGEMPFLGDAKAAMRQREYEEARRVGPLDLNLPLLFPSPRYLGPRLRVQPPLHHTSSPTTLSTTAPSRTRWFSALIGRGAGEARGRAGDFAAPRRPPREFEVRRDQL